MRNREISFRVWNNKTKIWEHGNKYPINLIGETILLGGFLSNISMDDLNNCIPMQFTGLLDKNSKQIFESDIINFKLQGTPHGPEAEEIKGAEVWYEENDGMFVFGFYKDNDVIDYHFSMADKIDRTSLEVVGNIFENPELKTDYEKETT